MTPSNRARARVVSAAVSPAASSSAPPSRPAEPERPRRLLFIALGGLAAAAIAAVVVLHLGGGEAAGPGPLVAALRATDFRYPADPRTGYRRLSTPFAQNMTVTGAALGRDGTVAIALEDAAGRGEIVVWRAGRWRDAPTGTVGVTSMAVGPGGDVYVGRRDDCFERLPRDGQAKTEGPVATGYPVVGFAFDERSKHAALALAGGEVRTALRPFTARSLRPVHMPPRVRIRVATFDAEGRLVVGGDAGALFVATDDGWDDHSLPSHGRVVALGQDQDGHVLVAEDDGSIFRMKGAVAEHVGQTPSAPVAVGAMPGRGVVVVTDDGRLFASGGGDHFAAVKGRRVPLHMHVHAAAILGHDVIVTSRDRVQVLDDASDAVWDSTDAAVRAPAGVAATGCHPVGPLPRGAKAGEPAPMLLGCDDGSFAVLDAKGLTPVTHVKVGDASVPAGALAHALETARTPSPVWLGGRLVAPKPASESPGLRQWDPRSQSWDTLASFDPSLGSVAFLSGHATGDGLSLFAALRTDTVVHAVVGTSAAGPVTPTPVVSAADFATVYGAKFAPFGIGVHALGGGHALVEHRTFDGLVLSRIDVAAPHAATRVAVPNADPRDLMVLEEGGRAFVASATGLWEVSQSGAPASISVPGGVRFGSLSGEPFAAAPAGTDGLVLVGEEADDGSAVLLRCDAHRCRRVPLPAGTRVRGTWLESGRRCRRVGEHRRARARSRPRVAHQAPPAWHRRVT